MATVPQSLAGLSLAEKRMLLAQLLQEKADESATVFPLSYGQRGLWFLHQMDRQGASYNVCYPSRIRSSLDLAAFRRAVQKLIDRHHGLRTTFEERDGVLLQRVHELLARVEDLSGEEVDALLASLLLEKGQNGDGSGERLAQPGIRTVRSNRTHTGGMNHRNLDP